MTAAASILHAGGVTIAKFHQNICDISSAQLEELLGTSVSQLENLKHTYLYCNTPRTACNMDILECTSACIVM